MADKVEEVREVRTNDGVDENDDMVQRQAVRRTTTVPGSVVGQRVVWYIVGVIIALLVIRLVLLLLGANQGNAFVDFIYGLSGIFAVPFYGIFSYTPAYGHSVLELSSVVAIIVYALIGWGVAKLMSLGSNYEV